ncbi:MAG: tRNA (adenosine(37)-N6)-threonylcarbamoyltransferase complex dimerization subunit type 1 TsaB [Thermoflexales bacterium]
MSSTLLAIDTCTRRSSIALRNEHTLLGEITWEAQREETARVSARIEELLRASHVSTAELAAIAVAIGPGSFTGVRCGLAIAKGMALAQGLPLIGVTAFDVLAHAQPCHHLPMLVVLEAGRSRAAICRYDWIEDVPHVADTWRIVLWEELVAELEAATPTWVCGEVAPHVWARLPAHIRAAPPAWNLRRAGFLADLAFNRWSRGEVDDVMTLTAIYPPEA